MADQAGNSRSSLLRFLPVAIVVAAVVLVLVLVAVRHPVPLDKTEGKDIGAKKSAQALAEERMADKEYRKLLEECKAEQDDAARKIAAVRDEIALWVSSNESARALSEKLATIPDSPGNEDERQKAQHDLDELLGRDPAGKALLLRRQDATDAFEQARVLTAVIIGAKLREQTESPKDDKAE